MKAKYFNSAENQHQIREMYNDRRNSENAENGPT